MQPLLASSWGALRSGCTDGVIFGLFDPASIDFLLAISVIVSIVNAGTTASAFGSA